MRVEAFHRVLHGGCRNGIVPPLRHERLREDTEARRQRLDHLHANRPKPLTRESALHRRRTECNAMPCGLWGRTIRSSLRIACTIRLATQAGDMAGIPGMENPLNISVCIAPASHCGLTAQANASHGTSERIGATKAMQIGPGQMQLVWTFEPRAMSSVCNARVMPRAANFDALHSADSAISAQIGLPCHAHAFHLPSVMPLCDTVACCMLSVDGKPVVDHLRRWRERHCRGDAHNVPLVPLHHRGEHRLDLHVILRLRWIRS